MSDKLLSNSFIADKTSVSIPFLLISSAGADVTGKVAADLTAYYWRQGGTFTSISLSNLAALNSAYSSGGVKEGQNGLYRLDLPDAAIASGADWVVVLVICSGAISSRTQYAIESAGTVEINNVVANGTYGNSALNTKLGTPAGASVSADIAAIPAAVWAAGTRTLTSFGTLVADVWSYATRTITGGGGSAADIWGYATRTLTQPAASVISAVNGSEITAYRGTTWSIALTGLGNITGYTNLWFAIKQSSVYNTDNEAIVLIGVNSGLTRIDGAAYPTSSDGSITVNDATAGNITITLKPAASSLLKIQSDLDYGIKWINASGSEYQLSDGTQKFNIAADNPRAIA